MKRPSERKPLGISAAEWAKIHNACVKAETEPDERQIVLLEYPGSAPASADTSEVGRVGASALGENA